MSENADKKTEQIEAPLASHPENPRFTFIDLFAGIGGLRLAFQSAGGDCVYSNEWNSFSQKTYAANFGDMPEGDITKVDEKLIPDHDILIGGFPCQAFSMAGKKRGFEDTRGTLFFDVARVLREKRPKAFMLENVKNLASHDKGNTFRVIRETIEELDYQLFYAILDGQDFVPQHRERIVLVGFDRKRYGDGIEFAFDLVKPERKPVMRDILEDDVDEKYTLTDIGWDGLKRHAAKHAAKGNGFGYGIAPLDGHSRTLSARYYKDGSEILIEQPGKNPRRLTPRECARLQGFPEDFQIVVSNTQAYKQFGNSVVVPLMSEVARLVAEKLDELDAAVSE